MVPPGVAGSALFIAAHLNLFEPLAKTVRFAGRNVHIPTNPANLGTCNGVTLMYDKQDHTIWAKTPGLRNVIASDTIPVEQLKEEFGVRPLAWKEAEASMKTAVDSLDLNTERKYDVLSKNGRADLIQNEQDWVHEPILSAIDHEPEFENWNGAVVFPHHIDPFSPWPEDQPFCPDAHKTIIAETDAVDFGKVVIDGKPFAIFSSLQGAALNVNPSKGTDNEPRIIIFEKPVTKKTADSPASHDGAGFSSTEADAAHTASTVPSTDEDVGQNDKSPRSADVE